MSDQAAQNAVTPPAAPVAAAVQAIPPPRGGHDAAQAQVEKSAAIAEALKFVEESEGAIGDGAAAQGGEASDVPASPGAGDAGSADADGSAEGEPAAAADGAAAGADTGDADADGEDSDPADPGDEGAKAKPRTERSMEAEWRRKSKRLERDREAFDVERQSFQLEKRQVLAEKQQLLDHADSYGRQFAEADKDFGAFAELYAKSRGISFDDVVESVTRKKLGLGAGKPLGQQAQQGAQTAQTEALARELGEFKFLSSAGRSIAALGEKFPLTKGLDPMQFESVALQSREFLKGRLGREPNAEELFAPIEERLTYESWKQERAKGSAAKPNPATVPQGTVTVPGNGKVPTSAPALTAEHGGEAEPANSRRATPTTLSQADASVRTGAARHLSDDQARRAAIDEALRAVPRA